MKLTESELHAFDQRQPNSQEKFTSYLSVSFLLVQFIHVASFPMSIRRLLRAKGMSAATDAARGGRKGSGSLPMNFRRD
jgi:hypothetical protein